MRTKDCQGAHAKHNIPDSPDTPDSHVTPLFRVCLLGGLRENHEKEEKARANEADQVERRGENSCQY